MAIDKQWSDVFRTLASLRSEYFLGLRDFSVVAVTLLEQVYLVLGVPSATPVTTDKVLAFNFPTTVEFPLALD